MQNQGVVIEARTSGGLDVVGLDDFTAAALTDPQTLALARRLQIIEVGNPDPNALVPQRIEIDLAKDRKVAFSVDAVLFGSPRPLTANQIKRLVKRDREFELPFFLRRVIQTRSWRQISTADKSKCFAPRLGRSGRFP